MPTTLELLSTLLDNYFNAVLSIESALVFDRNGLLIAKKSKGSLIHLFEKKVEDEKEAEIYGAISAIVDSTLKRITTEYDIGSFGTGSFETEDHRLVFTEAGPKAILLTVFQYDVELNQALPYCFLVAEKVSNILEGRFSEEFSSLSVPSLELGYELGINPSSFVRTPVQFNDQNEIKKTELRFKLIVMGDAAVGKTSLINQFVTRQFFTDYRPTLGISITSQVYSMQGFEDTQLNFMIWDLAGQKFFQRVRKHYYQNANAAFIIYDISNRASFDNVTNWYEDVKSVMEDIPIVILGNKVDLETDRVVSQEEGRAKAKELRCSFMETSAKTGHNVRDAFSIIGIGLFFKAALY